MDCGNCEPFVNAVKQHYAYLFNEYGFRVVHCLEVRDGEYCLVGLESDQARIKVELEQGVPATYLGTLETPMQVEDQVDGVKVWYAANAVLNFVERVPVTPSLDQFLQKEGRARTTDEILADDARRLRPHVDELLKAFGPQRPAEWWQAFGAYAEEEARAIDEALNSF